ncbi:hypothetical protein D0817_09700 [Flavobacterium cupreum]|uniref:Uncharacterized protein n=1 Tax=Flavobacterium cupreum TaxID=2133766 RepID=A0A434A8R9_9FLAO|nr:hypothetical protein [Flavobacterium cupreum]RUT70736.1 hypothetical protein D0817_09700 [Flavobacterium cupreum]
MKESDKNIEHLIDKMMTESTLESPCIDFTSKVMDQVLAAEKSKTKVYKPLISKTTWILLGAGLTALIAYSIYSNSNTANLETSQLYLNLDKASSLFSGIHFSKNILYAVLIVPIMILIQIGVLKNYFDKKYGL